MPPLKPPIDTILFDVGFTLTFVDVQAVQSIVESKGLAPREIESAERSARREMYLGSEESRDLGRWFAYVRSLLRHAGVAEETFDDLTRDIHEEHTRSNLWRVVPDETRTALDRLERLPIRMGAVSNSDGSVRGLLERSKLDHYFEAIVDSHVVGIEKPDPRIFQIALDEMSAGSEGTVYVGDYPDVDVVGARRAELQPVVLDPLDLFAAEEAVIVSSLKELVDRVEEVL